MIKVTGALLGALLFVMPIGVLPPKPPPPILCIDAFPVSDPMCALTPVEVGTPRPPGLYLPNQKGR